MNVLFVGAHNDDIEIHCMATLLKLNDLGHKIYYLAFCRCEDLSRNKNLMNEWKQSKKILDEQGVDVAIHDLENRRFPDQAQMVRTTLEVYRNHMKIDLVFSHSPDDIHQDHETVGKEVRRVFKYQSILFYGGPHSNPKLQHDFFISIDSDLLRRKMEIWSLFKSQHRLFNGKSNYLTNLLMHFGALAGTEFAEGFKIHRMVANIWFTPEVSQIQEETGQGEEKSAKEVYRDL